MDREAEQQKIKEFFEQNLKAEDYLETISSDWPQRPDLFQFMMTFMRDVFHSGRFSGTKLLEIGSGATVHNVAAASAYFPNMTLSDYVPDNVESLKRWLEGKSKLQQLLDVPAKLEGFADDLDTGVRILESRIRKTVKRVARCDLLTDQVLLDESGDPETSPPFDVVLSCLCLETAVVDYSGYCEVLKRVGKLLKKGGGLVIGGFLEASPWIVGGKAFNHISIGERELLDALGQAGFGNIDLQTKAGGSFDSSEFKFGKLYCVAAEKL